jgi:hypothetical protein
MLFYAICLVIVAISAGGILMVVARKFAQLTLIDTASLPKEREAKKKKEIIQSRVGRKLAGWGEDALRLLLKPFELLRNAFRRQYRKILALDKQLRHKTLDVEGVQFHPESILTVDGKPLLRNWLSRQ